MDPIAEQHPEEPARRRSLVGRGVLATGAAVIALGIGAVGASAGSSGAAASEPAGTPGPAFVQEPAPEQPADPAPRGDGPCPERDGGGEQGSGGATQAA